MEDADQKIQNIIYRIFGTKVVDDRGQPQHALFEEAKAALKDLYIEGQIAELENLPKPDGTITTTAYGLKIDHAIQTRLLSLKSKGAG